MNKFITSILLMGKEQQDSHTREYYFMLVKTRCWGFRADLLSLLKDKWYKIYMHASALTAKGFGVAVAES